MRRRAKLLMSELDSNAGHVQLLSCREDAGRLTLSGLVIVTVSIWVVGAILDGRAALLKETRN